jgi:hypothetical protein
MQPIVRHLIACEDIQHGRSPERFALVQVITRIRPLDPVPFPLLYRKICFLTICTDCRGQGQVRLRLVEVESGMGCHTSPPWAVTFGNDPLQVVGFPFRIRDLRFPRPGVYLVQLWYDDVEWDQFTAASLETDMSTRYLVTLLTALLLLTLAATAPAGGDKKSTAPQPLGKPDLVVSPADWRAEFKKDSQAARAKYRGKVIEMSGTVSSARPDPYGLCGYISLDVADDAFGVRCVLTDLKPWKRVSPGSKVKVRGKSSDLIAGDLRPCEIVEAGPNPGVVITAEELSRQFAANRKQTSARYDGKWAYVKGKVSEKSPAKSSAAWFKLKGAGGITVKCSTGDAYKDMVSRVKVGARIEVFGQLQIFDGPADREISVGMYGWTDAK